MLGIGKALSSQFGQADCQLLPCPGWDCGALLPSATLRVDGNWLAGDPAVAPVLLIAHLLAGGPCFFLKCDGRPGKPPPRPWADLHAQLAGENRAGVLKTAGRVPAEVMMVPLTARDAASGTAEPVFAGFVASLTGGDFVRQLLLTLRLPLVFDLDETLLVAKSQSQMAKELKALRDVRRPALQRAATDPQRAVKLLALDREEQLMTEDLALLQQFAEDDAVTYKGQHIVAQIEEAMGDDMAPISRPVIRLPGAEDTLLTRIEPGNPHSSMVFKLRPNWRAIWGYLGGLMDPHTHQPITYTPPSPRLRFEAYVCTAAERGYALEAWRVLDPDGWMIPLDQRQRRLHSGSKQKSLGAVLHLGRVPLPGPNGAVVSPMPLAAIVDDRVEIWDVANRGQVLQVEPFKPWEEQAAQDLQLADTPTTQTLSAQMIRLKEELFNLRLHAFHRTQEVLRRQVELLRLGQQHLSLARPLHESYAAALAPPPWVEGLLAAGLHRQQQPELLPASLQAAMERPVDPRQLRRQQRQATAQQQQQEVGVPQPQREVGGPETQAQQLQPAGQAMPLVELAGPAGLALMATLQGILGGSQPPQQQPGAPPPTAGAVPVDPRLQLRQQHQQQQQLLQQQQQPMRPQRQRPGKMAGPVAPEQVAAAPGVALLQRQMAADPRRRPTAPPAGAVTAAASSTLSEALGLLPSAAPTQPQLPPTGPRPPPMVNRLVGLHGPPPQKQPPPQQPAQVPAKQQQQAAWGTTNANMPAMLGMAPGAGQVPRPMQRVQPQPPQPQQQQGPAGAGDEMRQRWLETFNSMGQGGPALGTGPMQAAPRPMHRAQVAPEQQAGAKRKAPDCTDGDEGYKQPRYDQQQQQQQQQGVAAPPPGTNGRDALAQLYNTTQRQQARLQWRCSQQMDGSWQAAAYVGTWPTDFPPPNEPPASFAAGPTQHAAMQAAAAAAVQRLGAAGDGGVPHASAAPAGSAPLPYAQATTDGSASGSGVNSRNAIDTLIGHFPAATNRIEWQEQPKAPDGGWRYRLVVNGGEFEAVGSGPPGLRGEKRARQHAALLVLQKTGYAVSFDNPGGPPSAPAPVGSSGYGRGGGGGSGAPGRGTAGGPQQDRLQRYAGRSLDSRHAAAAAAQQQHGVGRDTYLASLNDELP